MLASAGAAVKSYTDGMRILGPLCALIALYATIALAVRFVPRIGQAPAASLMRAFSLYLCFVSNQRFIEWLEEEPSHDNT